MTPSVSPRTQTEAMRWLQRANPKTTRAWRLKLALNRGFANVRSRNQATWPASI